MRDGKLLEDLRQALESVDLDGGVANLNKSLWQRLIGKTDDSSLETQWMAAELFDYAGQYVEAQEILSACGPNSRENLADALRARYPRRCVEGAYWQSYKQHCLVAIQWGFTFYRRHQYDKAKEIWTLCRDFVEKCLNSQDDPCHGTLSRLYYGIGLIHRQRFEYSEARKMFTESIAPAQGVSFGGKIRLMPDMPLAEEFSVLAHELAHEMLHHAQGEARLPKTVAETQAEAVAYVVCRGVGLETNSAAADYIHLYNSDKKTLAESLSVIQETSSKILDQLLAEQHRSPFHEKPGRSFTDVPAHSHGEAGPAHPASLMPPAQAPDQSDSISMER